MSCPFLLSLRAWGRMSLHSLERNVILLAVIIWGSDVVLKMITKCHNKIHNSKSCENFASLNYTAF